MVSDWMYPEFDANGDEVSSSKTVKLVRGAYWWCRFWFSLDNWKWLLGKPSHEEVSRWEAFRCRLAGHPCGTIFYNPGGYEPDDRCKNCYDHIG